MVRAAIYARISQDDLGTEKGVTRQLEDARKLAEGRGWEIVGEYADNDVSAYNGARREQYQRLMADAEAGAFDRIVVYQTSRLWRSRPERADAMEVLGERRISVAAVQGPELDLATASGRMIAGVLGEFDTAESAIKSERVARAALQRAQEGRANGVVAYGWRREYDTDATGRRIGFRDVEDPDEAAVVREIVDRMLAGDGVREIARDLNARGVPTPSRRPGTIWRHTTIRKLALRPGNVALRVHRGEIIGEAAWPAIVDQDKHDRVTAILTAPKRRQANDAARKHLLTYGAVGACGVCGGVLRVSLKGNARYGTKQLLYVCDAAGCVGRNEERVDELVRAVVIERLSRPDAADLVVGGDDDAREAMIEADRLRTRLADAADQYADGILDADNLRRINEKLRPEIERLEQIAARTRRTVQIPTGLLGENAGAIWDGLDVVARRGILEAIGLRATINRQRPGPGFDPEAIAFSWTAQAGTYS